MSVVVKVNKYSMPIECTKSSSSLGVMAFNNIKFGFEINNKHMMELILRTGTEDCFKFNFY